MRKILFITIILANAIWGTKTAWACSCIETPSPLAAKEAATAVFTGQVEEIKMPKILTGSTDTMTVIFSLANTWKGPDFKTLKIHTPVSSAACGYEFTVGEEYLVYASGVDDFLQVGLCDRIVKIADASADFDELGHGLLPTALNNQDHYYLAAQSLGIIIFIMVLWIIIINKKKK